MSIKKIVEAWRLWFIGDMFLIKLVVVAHWLCGYFNLWCLVRCVEGVIQIKIYFGGIV